MDKLERNKKNVTAFYDLMFNQSKPAEAFKLYGGATYKQHNPTVPDGKEAFIEFFDQLSKQVPEKHVSVKHVVAEGDLVVLHGEQSYGGPDKTASVDIFKVDDDGKIIEHWDVLQPEPKESKNDNGMV